MKQLFVSNYSPVLFFHMPNTKMERNPFPYFRFSQDKNLFIASFEQPYNITLLLIILHIYNTSKKNWTWFRMILVFFLTDFLKSVEQHAENFKALLKTTLLHIFDFIFYIPIEYKNLFYWFYHSLLHIVFEQ